jgi:hypothetical protein
MAFTTANDIIAILKQQLGLDEKTYAIMQIWERELGPLAGSAQLVGFYKRQLLVEVASSVHLQEMTLRRRDLINKINQYFGREKVVKDIKLRLKK